MYKHSCTRINNIELDDDDGDGGGRHGRRLRDQQTCSPLIISFRGFTFSLSNVRRLLLSFVRPKASFRSAGECDIKSNLLFRNDFIPLPCSRALQVLLTSNNTPNTSPS